MLIAKRGAQPVKETNPVGLAYLLKWFLMRINCCDRVVIFKPHKATPETQQEIFVPELDLLAARNTTNWMW